MNAKLNGAPLVRSEPERWQLIGPALQIVRAGPMSGLVILVSSIVAVALGSWIPLGVGVLTAAGVVVKRLLAPGVWRAAEAAEASRAVTLPPDTQITDPAAKLLLARIVEARAELDDVLGTGAMPDRADILIRIRTVRDIERAAVAALQRIEFLSAAPASGGRAGSPPSDRNDAGADVGPNGPILERAAAARAERLDALHGLDVRRQQELARLEYLTSCLEAIPVALMELQVLERDELERSLPDPVRDADLLRDEVRHVREEIGDSRMI